MKRSIAVVLFAGALAACAGSEKGPPATGSGGASTGGTTGGSAGSGGAAGTAGAGGTGGTAGTAGAGATGGRGGTIGSAGDGVAGNFGSAGSGGTTGTAGGGGTAGGAAGQGGRGGGVGGRGGGGGGSGSSGASGAVGTGGTTGTGGAATGCAGKTYKLCEDFETGNVGSIPPNWTGLTGYGTDSMKGVGLATDQFHSGAMALKSSSMNPGEQRVQHSLSALGATATKHWGRIFYKVISPSPKPASGNVIHVTMVALQGAAGGNPPNPENRIVDTVEQSNGTHQWIFNIPDDSCCTGSNYSWSFDANWHCAEWYVDVSSQSYRFFTDGTEVTMIGFTGKAAAKMSSYPALAVGAIFYQAPPSPFTIWFDDLAIDDNQIGCQ